MGMFIFSGLIWALLTLILLCWSLRLWGSRVPWPAALSCFLWLVFFLLPARVTLTLGFWKFRPPFTSLGPSWPCSLGLCLLSLCALAALAQDLAHGAPWLMLSERTTVTEVWILLLGLRFFILKNPNLESSSEKSGGLFSPSFSLAC